MRVSRTLLDAISRALVVLVLMVFALLKFRPFEGATEVFLLTSVGAVLLVHAATRPGWREAGLTLAIGATLFFSVDWLAARSGTTAVSGLIRYLGVLGMAGVIVLGVKAIRRTEGLRPFLLALFVPLQVMFVSVTLSVMSTYTPYVYDQNLFHFDRALGGFPSFAVGRLFRAWHWLAWISLSVYASLPTAMVGCFLLYFRKPERFPANAVIVVVAIGVLGFGMYHLCPAVGPIYLVKYNFPYRPPENLGWGAIGMPGDPRNAMPSLHAAWVYVLWWNLRRYHPLANWASGLYLFFTLLATLGYGEHYLVDLIVAAPFALGIQALCQKRWRLAAAGLAPAIGFGLFLRWMDGPGWLFSPIAWALIGFALGLSFWAARRLERPGLEPLFPVPETLYARRFEGSAGSVD